MTLDEIEALARKMRAAGLAELEYDSGGTCIILRSGTAGSGAPMRTAPAPVKSGAKAPMFGHFCPVHPQRIAPEVSSGDPVEAGQYLGFVEAGGVFYPVTAPCAGRVARILPEAGALVGYGEMIVEFD